MKPKEFADYLIARYGQKDACRVIDGIINGLDICNTDDVIYYRQVKEEIEKG